METEEKKLELDNTQPEVKETPTNTEPETQEQINWKKFREAREIDRKQKIDAERRASEKEAEAQALKAAMEALLNKSSTNSSDNGRRMVDEDDISDDERIRRQVETIIADRDRKQEEFRRQKEIEETPITIKNAMPDFHEVCSPENVDYLEYHYPSIAKSFRHMPEGFEKWQTVYESVKKLVPNLNSKKEQAKAERNFNKPQAMSVAGKTQVGDTAPQSLDDKRKTDNWLRMQKVMRGA
jgi:hypothetical protein